MPSLRLRLIWVSFRDLFDHDVWLLPKLGANDPRLFLGVVQICGGRAAPNPHGLVVLHLEAHLVDSDGEAADIEGLHAHDPDITALGDGTREPDAELADRIQAEIVHWLSSIVVS